MTELVRALEVAGVPRTRARFARGVPSLRSRVAERLGVNRAMVRDPRQAVLVPLMGPNPDWLFPYSATRECVLFCWDVWPPDAARWARLLRRHRIRFAVMTARASALSWRASVPGLRTAWIAEAADPLPGAPGASLEHRRVQVLELGRRHAAYHAAVAPRLARSGVAHRYEHPPGSVVFPTLEDLTAGLLDTVVSVCFPSSVTHPGRSGDVATLTRRYLESMAAGSVIVGSAPAELVDLFGYDPVIAVDWSDPAGQLLEIVRHPQRQRELVARNYARFLEIGTWQARVPTLLSTLRSWGLRW